MDVLTKLSVLTAAAKYDAACTSSGVNRSALPGQLGGACQGGICHSFAADGRCITLLKVLMTNNCVYDCAYCANRRSNEVARAAFKPRELADLTIEFYRRNYIEGLFLSSGVARDADFATTQMIKTLDILRNEYGFNGYIHAKAIPGASDEVLDRLGFLADRLSVNIELPTEASLRRLAPDKDPRAIGAPLRRIRERVAEGHGKALARRASGRRFAPAGQSTQMIIGATPDTDYEILQTSARLYRRYDLKRVFFSAYLPVGDETRVLAPVGAGVQLLREHRLYQADWLLRFYEFAVDEIISPDCPQLDPLLDPKCFWALNHLDRFPIEVNAAAYEELLRVPGIGVVGAKKILRARRARRLDFDALRRLRIVLKRAAWFITAGGKYAEGLRFDPELIYRGLTTDEARLRGFREVLSRQEASRQLSLFDTNLQPVAADGYKALTGQL
jgi:putative DNA modification/repair radical SAM protein